MKCLFISLTLLLEGGVFAQENVAAQRIDRLLHASLLEPDLEKQWRMQGDVIRACDYFLTAYPDSHLFYEYEDLRADTTKVQKQLARLVLFIRSAPISAEEMWQQMDFTNYPELGVQIYRYIQEQKIKAF